MYILILMPLWLWISSKRYELNLNIRISHFNIMQISSWYFMILTETMNKKSLKISFMNLFWKRYSGKPQYRYPNKCSKILILILEFRLWNFKIGPGSSLAIGKVHIDKWPTLINLYEGVWRQWVNYFHNVHLKNSWHKWTMLNYSGIDDW